MNLSHSKPQQLYKITKVELESPYKKRIQELGIIRNAIVKIEKKSPLGDPIIVHINNGDLVINKKTAQHIYIEEV